MNEVFGVYCGLDSNISVPSLLPPLDPMATIKDSTSPAVDEKDVRSGPEPEPEPVSENVDVQYSPQDGGIKAWLFLIGASIVEITAWGSTPDRG